SECSMFFFSSRRRHTRFSRDWSSDVCSSDLPVSQPGLTLALPLAIIGCTLTHRQADTSSYVAECPAHPCSCPPGGLRTTAAHRPANRHSVATVANLLGALAGGRGGSVICQPADLYPGRIFHAGRRLCHQRFCRPGLGSPRQTHQRPPAHRRPGPRLGGRRSVCRAVPGVVSDGGAVHQLPDPVSIFRWCAAGLYLPVYE